MKIIRNLIFVILLLAGLTSCASNSNNEIDETNPDTTEPGGSTLPGDSEDNEGDITLDKKMLTVYFSASSSKRTKNVAEIISTVTSSDLYEIVPRQIYTEADLNYNNSSSRSSRENSDASARPEIGSSIVDVSGYDVIFIGYPIWWAKAPKIIYTFLDTYDFTGKTLVPFATSSSTGITGSESALHNLEPNATWLSGRLLNNASTSTVTTWVNSLGL